MDNDSMTVDSLRRRYIAKLSTNVFNLGLAFVVMAIVPRALGPADMGRVEFITTCMAAVFNLVSFSLPAAYFAWLAQTEASQERGATIIVLGISSFLFAGVALTAGFLHFAGLGPYLWPDISGSILLHGICFAGLTFLLLVPTSLADARAYTVPLEIGRISISLVRTVVLAAVFYFAALNIHSYFVIQNVFLLIFILGLGLWLFRRRSGAIQTTFSREDRQVFSAFCWKYIKPLIPYTMISLGYTYADRWLLQLAGGAAEQGFYGFSYRFASVAFIFTSAMTPVIMRDFGVAWASKDFPRLRSLMGRARLLVAVAAMIAAFLCCNARAIVLLFGGPSFKYAIIPFSLMALYPIHQTFGQLTGGFLYAVSRTDIISIAGGLTMVLSIPITYFLVATPSMPIPGLALGAIGFSAKMVALQVIHVNIYLYIVTRILRESYRPWLAFQFKIIGVTFLPAFLASLASRQIPLALASRLSFFSAENLLLAQQLLVSCILTGGMYGLLSFYFPESLGLKREDWIIVKERLGRFLKK
jgi:O-antigen/teichoic acid export membrane protein